MALAGGYRYPGYGRGRRHGGAFDGTGGHAIGTRSDGGSYNQGAAFGAGGEGAYSGSGHTIGHGHGECSALIISQAQHGI